MPPSATAKDSQGRRHFLWLAAGSTVAVPGTVGAQARGEVRVLLAAETAQHTSLVQALRSRWSSVSTYTEPARAVRGRAVPIAYVAIGPLALQQAVGMPLDAPLISAFVSRQAYAQLINAAPVPPRSTAVYAEASPLQQMRTIAALMRRPVTVGALVSDQPRDFAATLAPAAQTAGLAANVQRYDPAIGMSRNLLRLTGVDALLIHPDTSIFNPASLRELLESTYRRRQPVFGFSEALVTAGTLASAFAHAEDLAAHLAEVLASVSEGRMPAPQYPRYWRTAINDSVARSLDIVIDSNARSLGDRP